MAAKSKTDAYANIAAVQVVESAINTQTAAKFAFPFSIMDKMGLIISRIEYLFGELNGDFNAGGDFTTAAITVGSTVNDILAQNDPLILDCVRYSRVDLGAAASGIIMQQPYMKDFSTLPGGGLLVAPNPLYAMIQGNGVAQVQSVWIKLFYTYIELSAEEYWQLVESRRIIST